MYPTAISKYFLNILGMVTPSLPGLNNPVDEDIFPNIQLTLPLAWLGAISPCPIPRGLGAGSPLGCTLLSENCGDQNEHPERLVHVKPLLNFTVHNVTIPCRPIPAYLWDQLAQPSSTFNKRYHVKRFGVRTLYFHWELATSLRQTRLLIQVPFFQDNKHWLH